MTTNRTVLPAIHMFHLQVEVKFCLKRTLVLIVFKGMSVTNCAIFNFHRITKMLIFSVFEMCRLFLFKQFCITFFHYNRAFSVTAARTWNGSLGVRFTSPHF